MTNLKINDTILLPSDLNITPHGLTCLPYRLVGWKITALNKERVTLERGKKAHTKYTDTVIKIITVINNNLCSNN